MTKRINRTEMNMKEMDQVAGGYVLGRWINADAWVVDDVTGEKISSAGTVGKAQRVADELGVNPKVITPNEYLAMFNKDPYADQ